MIFYCAIFEKGVEITKDDNGLWYFQSSSGKLSVASLIEVNRKYKLRLILAKHRGDSHRDIELLVPLKRGEKWLEVQLSQLAQTASRKGSQVLFGTLNLTYVVESVCYHCKCLCKVYSNICRLFAESMAKLVKGHDTIDFGGQSEPYFEFEALITSALRAYNAARYIIWTAFGPGKGSVPNSFTRTLSLCNNFPVALRERLNSSWQQYGAQIQEYRDCVQHYVSVGGLLPGVKMTKLEGDVWSASAWIPDNPKVRSYRKFTYSSRIDALTYAWEIANEILEISDIIVRAVPEHTERKDDVVG